MMEGKKAITVTYLSQVTPNSESKFPFINNIYKFSVSNFEETNWACPAQQLYSFPLGTRLTRERTELCFSSQGPAPHKEACRGLALP